MEKVKILSTRLSVLLQIGGMLPIISGCSDDSPKYPSSKGASPSYILKEGCKFTIVEELSKASISSPKVTGAVGFTVSMGGIAGR